MCIQFLVPKRILTDETPTLVKKAAEDKQFYDENIHLFTTKTTSTTTTTTKSTTTVTS